MPGRTSPFLILLVLALGFQGGCQSKPAVDVYPSKTGEYGVSQGRLLHFLKSANEALDSLSAYEMMEHFSVRDAKGNRIRHGLEPGYGKWALLDAAQDRVAGTSTERAYRELTLRTPEEPIIVAVIDSGVDIHHEDLAGVIWTNEKEANGIPGVDNDGNGYVGDVHGWNFLGSADGRQLIFSSLEVTREVARMRKLSAERELSDVESAYLEKLEEDFEAQSGVGRRALEKLRAQYAELALALDILRGAGLQGETLVALDSLPAGDELLEQARALARKYLERFVTPSLLAMRMEWLRSEIEPYFDLAFDPSEVIGDDPSRLDDIGYGNPDVTMNGDHGTHVAGIIGAIRDNGIGINGQSAFVRIMPLRAIPNGDERDKDVANAIRYAVDNGARIINMSFGKYYSPHREYVDEAILYANRHGVLIVHASGNDSVDLDQTESFPRRPLQNGAPVENWIEVGASTSFFGRTLVAGFSNYGQKSVDLFAPGMGILSTVPQDGYQIFDGSSMAAPQVSGIAALILSQYPRMTPKQLREVLMRTVRRDFPSLVETPGSGILVDFSKLSLSGGIVNALDALKGASFLFGTP